LVGASKTGREEHPEASKRQIDILTTAGDPSPEQIIHGLGWRWRQKDYVRYARMHRGLDAHDGQPPPMTTRPWPRELPCQVRSQKPHHPDRVASW